MRSCPGCNSSHTFDGSQGKSYSVEELLKEISSISSEEEIDGITISGGEPFLQANLLSSFCREYLKSYPSKDVCIYTGYTAEEILQEIMDNMYQNVDWIRLLSIAKYIIDGPYDINKLVDEDVICPYRSTTNQKIIDGINTWRTRKVVEYEKYKVKQGDNTNESEKGKQQDKLHGWFFNFPKLPSDSI